MTASFFRRLEAHAVSYLLVSGQATILYGAATFSEDVDLWVEPGEENLVRLRQALRDSGATYYKLTPPLTSELARRHHGFHFTVPVQEGAPLFLDVVGAPPRVGDFSAAFGRARVFDTDWGLLHVVSIPELVELKKTQRPRDYPIIGRLVLALMRERGASCTDGDRAWALDNVYGVAEFKRLVLEHPQVVRCLVPSHGPMRIAAELLSRDETLPETLEDDLEDFFDARTAPLRKADRRFWRPVIDELRRLRASGELLEQGTPV